MESTYVIFEIGARWGSGKPLFPLVGAGLAPQELKPPLSGINAVNCADRAQMTRLVAEVAECLGIRPKATLAEADVEQVFQINRQASIDRSLSNLAHVVGEAALKLRSPER